MLRHINQGEIIMALTLAQIRANLQAQDNKKLSSGSADATIYPHWNIPEGTTAKIRFLPDPKQSNTTGYFWVERSMIKLPFVGVKGQPDSKRVEVQVPCVEMYGKEYTCPILTQIRPWFKDSNLEELARKYWKKKSYIFQGFVRENPLNDDKVPENPIRRFLISPQIYNIIHMSLMDTELEKIPTDYEAGLDFIINKTSKGGYADYSTSKWSRKESALSSEELAAIEKYDLFNLVDFLPKKPTDVELKVIEEMFEASIDGRPYDTEAWGSYYKPFGVNTESTKVFGSRPPAASPTATSSTATSSAADNDADNDNENEGASSSHEPPFDVPEISEPVQVAKSKPTNQRAEDILAMIRSRSKVSS